MIQEWLIINHLGLWAWYHQIKIRHSKLFWMKLQNDHRWLKNVHNKLTAIKCTADINLNKIFMHRLIKIIYSIQHKKVYRQLNRISWISHRIDYIIAKVQWMTSQRNIKLHLVRNNKCDRYSNNKKQVTNKSSWIIKAVTGIELLILFNNCHSSKRNIIMPLLNIINLTQQLSQPPWQISNGEQRIIFLFLL